MHISYCLQIDRAVEAEKRAVAYGMSSSIFWTKLVRPQKGPASHFAYEDWEEAFFDDMDPITFSDLMDVSNFLNFFTSPLLVFCSPMLPTLIAGICRIDIKS
jgi:hypothetical protein